MTKQEMETALRDNVRLVFEVINNLPFVAESVDRDDLEQTGKIALWEAIKTYSEDCGFSFSTHCYTIIRNKLLDYLRSTMAMKNKPNENIDDFTHKEANTLDNEVFGSLLINEIEKQVGEFNTNLFLDRHIHKKTISQLAEHYDLSPKQVRNRLDKIKQTLKTNLKSWRD